MAETVISSTTKRIAVVTGGNKGIGLEICRQLASNGIMVVLTARDVKKGNEAVEKLKATGLTDVVFYPLDVLDSDSIASLAEFIETKYGKLDILVNNAGITGSISDPKDRERLKIGLANIAKLADPNPNIQPLKEIVKHTYETGENCLRTNYYGVKQVTKALISVLKKSNSAKVVNVSSNLGQLKFIPNDDVRKTLGDLDNLTEEKIDKLVEEFLKDVKEGQVETKGWPPIFPPYLVSKAALNAYTRISARKYPEFPINAVSPGFVSTDLNYNSGHLTVEEGAKGPVMLALLPEGGPSGQFFDQTKLSTFEG